MNKIAVLLGFLFLAVIFAPFRLELDRHPFLFASFFPLYLEQKRASHKVNWKRSWSNHRIDVFKLWFLWLHTPPPSPPPPTPFKTRLKAVFWIQDISVDVQLFGLVLPKALLLEGLFKHLTPSNSNFVGPICLTKLDASHRPVSLADAFRSSRGLYCVFIL